MSPARPSWLLALCTVLAVALSGCCCPEPPEPSAAAKERAAKSKKTRDAVAKNRDNPKVRKVSATKLIAAYKKDKRAADRKYRGRKIKTTAYVVEVAEGTFAESTLLLAPDAFTDPLAKGLIQCRVPEELSQRALKVPVGAKVTVNADCDGYSFDWISLEECRWKVVE